VRKLVLAVAAIILTGLLWSPPAEARCWWNGWRWHCAHYRHYWGHHYWRHHYWRSGYYPYRYYGYYYRPYYYRPYYCIPFTPFCA
jgi:hypothetical protein